MQCKICNHTYDCVVVNQWTELIFNRVSIFTLSANIPLLPALMAEAIYTNSAHQRVIGLWSKSQKTVSCNQLKFEVNCMLYSFWSDRPGFESACWQTFSSHFKSHQKSIFFFNKNEGNNQKVEHKVSGRVRVGVEKTIEELFFNNLN